MSIDYELLKNYMPDYLMSELGIRNLRANFPCPVCGNGTRTPCCHYDDRTERIKCFSCGWNGDVLDLVQEVEKITLTEAIERLESGFTAKSETKPLTSKEKPSKAAYDPHTAKYIEKCSQEEKAITYFTSRGFSEDTIRKYKLGFDKKRDVAIIPYENKWYIARKNYEDNHGKYLINKNSSRPFPYNYHRLLEDTETPVFIVEGEINALSLEELGFAACGIGSGSGYRLFTTFLQDKKVTRPLIVMLDNDEPGIKAQEQLLKGLPEGLRAFSRAFPFKEGQDINDLLKTDRKALKEKMEDILKQIESEPKPLSFMEKYNTSKRLDDFLVKIKSPTFRPIPTGFSKLDKKLGGGLFNGLIVVSAAPSEGKSALSMQLVETIAQNQEREVLVFSFEMSAEQLMARTISRLTYELGDRNKETALTSIEFMKGYEWDKLVGSKLVHVEKACELYKENIGNRVTIFDDCEPTLQGIKDRIAEYEKNTPGKKAPIILIDYLQLLEVEGKEFLSGCKDITLALKQYAIEKDTLVFLISSVNRESQKSGSSLTSSYGSSFAEYSADYMFTLDFTAIKKKYDSASKEELKQNPLREMTVTIQKNRMGSTGESVDFLYAAPYNHFTDTFNESELVTQVQNLEKRKKGGVL